MILIEEADSNSFLQKTITFQGSTLTRSSDYCSIIYYKRLLLPTHTRLLGYFIFFINISIIIYCQLIIGSYQSTMNTFGISLFQEPQEFIALYLGIKTNTPLFLQRLAVLLHRTKSPPLALTYTYHFLSDKTEEELSLDVIRFVSQLADLSQGVSMSSSLQGILSESSFLTELRHSLTHKTMVKGSILQLGKSLILQQLEDKYWNTTVEKLRQTYSISEQKLREYYRIIYRTELNESLSWLNAKHDSQQYFQKCSNYEYKEHITPIIAGFKETFPTADQIKKYYSSLSEQKQNIFQVLLFQQFLEQLDIGNESYLSFICRFIKQVPSAHFQNELVLRECYKAYFLKYLPHAKTFLDTLPSMTKEKVEEYWRIKQQQIGQLFTPA